MKKYLAEFIGTFVLVFGGVGSAVIASHQIGYIGVSFAFGLSLLTMVYAIGPISGCHINPAVTLGALLARKIGTKDAMVYMLAQVAGAIVAAALILRIATDKAGGYNAAQLGLGANGYGQHSPGQYSLEAAIAAEIILTMFLVFTVLSSTDARAPVGFAGIAIGFVLTLIHLVCIPITNTSVNPARSIGPAIFVGGWALQQLWAFIVAPFVGGALGALVYSTIRIPAEVLTTREGERALPSEEQERTGGHKAA